MIQRGRGGDSVPECFRGEGWRFCPRVIQRGRGGVEILSLSDSKGRGGVEILSLSDSEGRGGDSVPE